MAKTKLTLSVDKALIERAKQFSRRNDTTVSELVSRFLASLDDDRDIAAPITSRLHRESNLSDDRPVRECGGARWLRRARF